MTRSAILIFAIAACLLLPSTDAVAGSPRTHDGFFLHLSAGGGSANTEIDIPGAKTKVDGTTADLNLAVGACVAPNLAVHGTFSDGWRAIRTSTSKALARDRSTAIYP